MSITRGKRKKPKTRNDWGFVVNSGRMSSLGSSGATFIGHNSPRDVSAYRSTSGIGNAHLSTRPTASLLSRLIAALRPTKKENP